MAVRFGLGVASMLGWEIAKSSVASGLINTEGGNTSDPGKQKWLIVESNIIDQKEGDSLALSTIGRTALIAEKSIDARVHAGKEKQLPVVDILLGSAHGMDAPQIITDQQYRSEVISAFVRDVLGKLDTLLKTKYPLLQKYRSSILVTAAESLAAYNISTISMPWGERTIAPQNLSRFEANLLKTGEISICPAVAKIMEEVLADLHVSVPDDAFPDNSSFTW
jgi:hypothetical protein